MFNHEIILLQLKQPTLDQHPNPTTTFVANHAMMFQCMTQKADTYCPLVL